MTSGVVAEGKEMARKLMAHTRSRRDKQMKVVSQQDFEDDMELIKCALDVRYQDPGKFL